MTLEARALGCSAESNCLTRVTAASVYQNYRTTSRDGWNRSWSLELESNEPLSLFRRTLSPGQLPRDWQGFLAWFAPPLRDAPGFRSPFYGVKSRDLAIGRALHVPAHKPHKRRRLVAASA